MNLKEYKTKKMNDPEFAKAYEEIQPEMNVIRAIIDARISQNMTQKELAERTGIAQTEDGYGFEYIVHAQSKCQKMNTPISEADIVERLSCSKIDGG